MKLYFKLFSSRVAKLLVLNNEDKAYFKTKYPQLNTEVIYNFSLMTRLPIVTKQYDLIYFGTVRELKNIHKMIDYASKLNLSFHIFGPPENKAYEQLIDQKIIDNPNIK